MKVNFSKGGTFVPKWKGNDALPLNDQFSVDMKPLLMGDLMDLMDAQGAGMKTMYGVASTILPNYVNVSNLFDVDNQPVTLEAMMKHPAYMSLVTEIVNELVGISMPSDEETKN